MRISPAQRVDDVRPPSCMSRLRGIDAAEKQATRVDRMERSPHVAHAQRHSKSDCPHKLWQCWIVFVGESHPRRWYFLWPINRAEYSSWASGSLHAVAQIGRQPLIAQEWRLFERINTSKPQFYAFVVQCVMKICLKTMYSTRLLF